MTPDQMAALAAEVVTVVKAALAPVVARVDALEGKALIPGPPGADGLGFDDLAVELDERTLTLTFARGELKKSFPVTLPMLVYQGVYQDGKSYETGDTATWAGAMWHCNTATRTKPGDGSKDWTLMVKRGQNGRDGGLK